jgi:hypothetical protein
MRQRRMIRRMVRRADTDRTGAEAAAPGLTTSALETLALDHTQAHTP